MIKIKNLTKLFKNRKRKVKALDNINLTFESKGLYFILGPSGAGKTTLLNLISLQDRPTKGTIEIENVDISKLRPRSLAKLRSDYFGIVFQELNLINDFSVYQNIVLGLEIQKKESSKEEVIKILKSLNLTEEILEEKVYNLSGGQQQRVAIARAILKNSKVIICDEPTGSLDKDNAIEIMKILKKISEDRLVIVVSHNEDLSKQYADRTITLSNGIIKRDTKSIENEIEPQKIQMKWHTHLPFKVIWKIAISSFGKGIPKLIFTLISIVLTLGFFLTSMTLYTYDSNIGTEKILKGEGITYFDLKKYQNDGVIPTYFTESDLKILDEVYKGKYILSHSSPDIKNSPAYNYTSEDEENNGSKGVKGFESIKNVMYLSYEMLEKCKFKIIGALPETKEGIYEIALTKYDCYSLGWVNKEEMNNDAVFQAILKNKKYKIVFFKLENLPTIEFSISGIIDTNYEFLDENDPYFINKTTIQNDEINSVLFVSQNIFEQMVNFSIEEEYFSEKAYNDIYVLTEDKSYLKTDNVIEKFKENDVIVKRSSRIEYYIGSLNRTTKLYAQLGFIVSIFLLVISLFSFIGFIKFSIEVNKKKMKILRSLGISMLDSNHIFSLQTFFITSLCLLLSIIPYAIAIIQLNKSYLKNSETSTPILDVSIYTILLSFIGLLAISIITTTIINALTFNDRKLKFKEES